jgi:hypothetical protein
MAGNADDRDAAVGFPAWLCVPVTNPTWALLPQAGF